MPDAAGPRPALLVLTLALGVTTLSLTQSLVVPVLGPIGIQLGISAGAAETAFHEGKRQAGRYFWRWELPRVHHRFDLLESLDRTVLDTPPAWL